MAEALDFCARGVIPPIVGAVKLDVVKEILGRMERGQIDGRVVIDYR